MFQLRLLILSVCLSDLARSTAERCQHIRIRATSSATTRLVCCDRLIILCERSVHGHRSREATVRKRTFAYAGVECSLLVFRTQSKACT